MTKTLLPFKPLGSVVIVVPHRNAPLASESGIQLADVTYEPETSGTIVAIGDGFRCACCEQAREVAVKVGDRVVFGREAGQAVDAEPLGFPGQTFVLLQESELWAVVDEAAVCEVV